MSNTTARFESPAPGHRIFYGEDAAAMVAGARWACTCGAMSRAKYTTSLRAARERHDDAARAAARR